MSRKRSHSPDDASRQAPPGPAQDYFKSSSIEDRESTFVGYFSPTMSAKELQKIPEARTAMHRMAGWRKSSSQKTLSMGTGPKAVFVTGSDDDGEKWGGKRIEKVLNELQIEGSIVVARWYGGILLGPVRFTHIEDVAKEAFSEWKQSSEALVKKRKTHESGDDSPEARARLIKELTERDESIMILRQLLTEKTKVKKDSEDATSSQMILSPNKVPDYLSVPTTRLRQLDKARDATIKWILKQIDAAEVKEANET